MKYSKLKNSALALAVLTIINSLWISHVDAEDAFYDDIQIVKVGDQAKSADSQDKTALKEAKARAKRRREPVKKKRKRYKNWTKLPCKNLSSRPLKFLVLMKMRT